MEVGMLGVSSPEWVLSLAQVSGKRHRLSWAAPLSVLVFQDLVTMVEQLARFLGVSCDKAQLESLIEHCHQLVDQCCNAEALPVGRGECLLPFLLHQALPVGGPQSSPCL
jgi:hypothetical protein